MNCRICQREGTGAIDPTRCANCYNMGIVGFNAGRVLTETPIVSYLADVVNGLGTVERVTAMRDWLWALSNASAASELEGRKR